MVWVWVLAWLGGVWEGTLGTCSAPPVSFCTQIFCSRCSSHSAPLPRYGQVKPVRVCTHCYMFHVTPFCSDRAAV